MAAIETGFAQLVPPFVEVYDDMLPPSNDTMTVPFGCTKGWPAMPLALFAVPVAFPQLSPASFDVDISNSPVSGLSHSI